MTYKGTPVRPSADSSTETLRVRRRRHDRSKVMKGKTYNQEYSTQQDSFRFNGEIKKLSRQAKVKRIWQHQNRFPTNAKGTLGRKQDKEKPHL